jgi:carbon monoxide dehydrogenase subunit G
MAHYSGTVSSAHAPEQVWRYLADLRSIAEWDPSVDRIRLAAGEPGTVGAQYELEVSFLGRRVALPYVTAESEAPNRVVFTAETKSVAIRDEARIEPIADGSAVTWSADLRLKGARRILDPLVGLAFGRLGRRAARGLEQQLGRSTLEQPLEGVAA